MTTAPTRPSFVQIDLSAIANNVRVLRRCVPQATQIAAVMKADGYGHGAVAVAKTALAHGAARLCVATVPEGVTLRDAGIQVPILVLGPTAPQEIQAIIAATLTPAVMDATFVAALADVATRAGTVPYPVHVKVDTGMHRFGVPVGEAPALLQSLRRIVGITVEGVLTHFATADVMGDPYLSEQAARFASLLTTLETQGLRPPIVHAANSGAILQRIAPWDMVRAGIALYGLPPAPEFPADGLIPAMSVHTAIARVLTVPAGESIGYGRRFIAQRSTRAALLPLGYADGLSRALTNRGHVLIGGRRCALAGVVSMDQCVALLPDDLDATVGDAVVIVGAQGALRQSLTDLAVAADTINYDIAVRFGARLERIYLDADA